jgi:hypothetical protein
MSARCICHLKRESYVRVYKTMKSVLISYLLRRWRSGQSHLAVNQAASAYAGSNPARRTNKKALEMGLFRDGGREVRTYSECSCKHGAIMVLLFAGQHLFFGGTTMNHYREESTIRTEMVEILRYMWDRGHANTTGVSISERSSNNRIVVDQSGTGFTRCRATEDDLLVIDPDYRLVEDAPNGAHRKAPVNVVIQTEYYKPEADEVVFQFVGKILVGTPTTSDEVTEISYFPTDSLPPNTAPMQVERIRQHVADPLVVHFSTQTPRT